MFAKLKNLNLHIYIIGALLGYIIWIQFIQPYKTAIEFHDSVVKQWQFVKINPDRSLTWIGELPGNRPTPTTTIPTKKEK